MPFEEASWGFDLSVSEALCKVKPVIALRCLALPLAYDAYYRETPWLLKSVLDLPEQVLLPRPGCKKKKATLSKTRLPMATIAR